VALLVDGGKWRALAGNGGAAPHNGAADRVGQGNGGKGASEEEGDNAV